MLVLGEGRKGRVVGGELLGHLRHLLVVLQVIPHELEQGLLLGVVLYLALQVIAVLLQLFASVLVDLDLVLEARDDDLGVLLEVLQLDQHVGVLLLGHASQVVVDAHVLEAGEELAELFLRGALEEQPVDQGEGA